MWWKWLKRWACLLHCDEFSRVPLGLEHTEQACPDVVKATDKVGLPHLDCQLAFAIGHRKEPALKWCSWQEVSGCHTAQHMQAKHDVVQVQRR